MGTATRKAILWMLWVLAAICIVLSPFLLKAIRANMGEGVGRAARVGAVVLALAVLLLFSLVTVRENRVLRLVFLVAVFAGSMAAVLELSDAAGLFSAMARLASYLVLLLLYLAAARTGRAEDLEPIVLGSLTCLCVSIVEVAVRWFVPGNELGRASFLLNLAALAAAVLFWLLVFHPEDRVFRLATIARIRFLYGFSIFLVIVNAFFCTTRIGHIIREPAIGEFRSLYSADVLRKKGATWEPSRGSAGLVRRVLAGLRDTYIGETIYHTDLRDGFMRQGDSLQAYRENQIVEAFYLPAAVHLGRRLSGPDAGELARAAGESRDGYYHLSGPEGIITWLPRSAAWFTVAILAIALISVAEFIRIKSGI